MTHDFKEGERIKATIEGVITCRSTFPQESGGLRIDSRADGKPCYYWIYPGSEGVTVERVEDIRDRDVYIGANGTVYEAVRTSDGVSWGEMGMYGSLDDEDVPRPLTLIYRREAA